MSGLSLWFLRSVRHPWPVPGEGTRTVLEAAGLWPRLSAQAPWWHLLARGVASLGSAEVFPMRMQWLGHLLLAATAGLLYGLLHRVAAFTLDEAPTLRRALLLRVGALGSAAYLLAPPVWRSAQSPLPAILPLFLVAVCSALAQAYRDRGAPGLLIGFAAVAGMGVVESPLVLLLMPAWVAWMVSADLRVGYDGTARVSAKRGHWIMAVGLGAAMAAISLLVAARLFRYDEGFALRGFGRMLQVVKLFARDYLVDLRGALPPLGWLVVLGGVVLPWVVALGLARRVQTADFGFGMAFLYLTLGTISGLQLYGPSAVQVWTLLPSSTYRAGAVWLSAMTFGLVVIAWLLRAESAIPSRAGTATGSSGALSAGPASHRLATFAWGGFALVFSLGLLSMVAGMLPARREVGTRAALDVLRTIAERTIEDCRDHDWLITDGMNDDGLRLVAWQRGAAVRPISIQPQRDPWSRRVVARRLPDTESRELYLVGPHVMVRHWLLHKPELAERMVTQAGLDLWLGTPLALRPQRTLLVATRSAPTIGEIDALLLRHRPLWDEMQGVLSDLKPVEPDLAARLGSARTSLSRVANELGVLLQDLGSSRASAEAFTAARRMDPANISCRVNLWSLGRDRPSLQIEDKSSLVAEVRALSGALRRSDLLAVVRRYGTIRSPRVLTVLGAGLGAGGLEREAQARLEAARGLARPGSAEARVTELIGSAMQTRARNYKGARERYQRIIADAPDDRVALLGLAALEARAEGLAAGLPWIDRARQAGADAVLCDVLQATLCLEANQPGMARALLEPHIARRVRDPAIWALWGRVAIGLGDPEGFAVAVAELQRLPNTQRLASSLAAEAALHRGDLTEALRSTRRALTEDPGNPQLLSAMVLLCTNLGDYETARPYAERLLTRDPAHALARYALGTLHLLQDEPALAELHLARSAETAPSGEALNNLAYARLMLGRIELARLAVDAGLELLPDRPELWSTLAGIALAEGRPDASEAASRQALALAPDSADAALRLAAARHAVGDVHGARIILDEISVGQVALLDRDAKDRWQRLGALLND